MTVLSYLRENKFNMTPAKLKNHLEENVSPSVALAVKPTTIRKETVIKRTGSMETQEGLLR